MAKSGSTSTSTEFFRIISCALVGVIIRWSVAQFPYSGEDKPPMYGDYEAQRHWMEITTQLPIEQWYVDGPDNDLQYWGLDYPPLSAFHSYSLGLYFWNILPESLMLFQSRGYESQIHKFWMRLSVLTCDLLVPSIVIFYVVFSTKKSLFPKWIPILLAMMAPPFILIDYAHFQYNCVSLGLTTLAIISIGKGQMSIGSILFTLAVNHKQMSLYHAVPFFVHMVSVIIFAKKDFLTAFRVTLMIASTMCLMWLPFGDSWVHILQRIFPIKRGVYEDKVGSFWYVLDRFIPLKNKLQDSDVAQLCAIASGLLAIPGILHLYTFSMNKEAKVDDKLKSFILSLFNISLLLFLFSYHVHEKSIMLVVLPAVLLLQWFPFQAIWFTTVASLSLYPLFLEEGSQIALICVTIIFFLTAIQAGVFKNIGIRTKLTLIGSIVGYGILISGLHFITPPKKFPHLFQSGIAIYSFLHYAAFSIQFHFLQFQVGSDESEISQTQAKVTHRKKKKH